MRADDMPNSFVPNPVASRHKKCAIRQEKVWRMAQMPDNVFLEVLLLLDALGALREHTLDVRCVGFRYGNLSDTVVCEADVHAVAVVAEDAHLALVDEVATVAADEPAAEAGFDGLGGAAQHVVAQFAVRVVVYLHVVVLRLYVVEAVDVDTHLQSAGAIDEMDELGVGIFGLVVHYIHAQAVEQLALMTVGGMLQAYDIRYDNDDGQHHDGTPQDGEEEVGLCKVKKCGENGINERNHHHLATYPEHQMGIGELKPPGCVVEDDFAEYEECDGYQIEYDGGHHRVKTAESTDVFVLSGHQGEP